MSVILEAGEVVVVVSVEVGTSCPLPVADLGFLARESLVGAVLVLVVADMGERSKTVG